MSRLSADEIYQLARSVGFPPDTAVTMTAIALRESGGDTHAFNGKPPDESYGLWQLNMLGSLGAARRAQFGIRQNNELYDPVVNARAAYLTWGGNDANLDVAWYIERNAGERQKYLAKLPAAQAAAERVEPGATGGAWIDAGIVADAGAGAVDQTLDDILTGGSTPGAAAGESEAGALDIPVMAGIALAAVALYALIDR